MRAGLYLAVRLYLRLYALSLSVSLLMPFFALLFYAAGWVVSRGKADIDKFVYQLVGVVIAVIAQIATSEALWDLYIFMSGGQLEYLIASPSYPLAVLMAFYVTQFMFFGLGVAVTAAVVLAVIKGPVYAAAMTLAALTAAIFSLPLLGIALALTYLLPYVRNPGPLSSVLNAAVMFFGGALYPASILPGALQAISHLLPFATWAEAVRSLALALELPIRLLGPLLGYMAYFALGVVVWNFYVRSLQRSGRYHVW